MNILYIAYSCSPYKGSEDKIGWGIPIESAKTNRVFVITKEEHRQTIDEYLKQYSIKDVQFYYVDIPPWYKKFYKGFLYSGRLNVWHRRALPLAKEICKQKRIDVIHQITPIEFRSIGDYGTIPNVKFVSGPLGGGEVLPTGLKPYAKAHMMVEKVRSAVNWIYLIRFKLSGKLKFCDHILFANHETKDFMSIVSPKMSRYDVMTEIAIDGADLAMEPILSSDADNSCRFLVAGRLIYRKGHELLLDALKQIPPGLDYTCRIVGGGPELERLKKKCADSILEKHVVFTGKIPYSQMAKEYKNADVFIMPSLRETTGSVLLEAMAKGLPVITINKFGGATLVDDNSGWLYDGDDQTEYIENLRTAIVTCITQPIEVRRRGEIAKIQAEKNTWKEKLSCYNTIYSSLCCTTEE